jgi:hypothetical protein
MRPNRLVVLRPTLKITRTTTGVRFAAAPCHHVRLPPRIDICQRLQSTRARAIQWPRGSRDFSVSMHVTARASCNYRCAPKRDQSHTKELEFN